MAVVGLLSVGQVRGLRLPVTGGSAGPSYDADAAAYFAAMTVQPDATRKGLINTLIVAGKANGWWLPLDWFVPIAAHDAQAGRLNARAPAKSLVAVNSPTFTTDRGYSGDGTSSYLGFGEAFGVSGSQYIQDNASFGAYCNQQNGAAGSSPHVGQTSGTAVVQMFANNSTVTGSVRINDVTSSAISQGTATRLGHRALVRSVSTEKRAFMNGGAAQVFVVTSAALQATENRLLSQGTSNSFSADRLAATFVGRALTDAQVASLHTDLVTYLTAIGAN